MSNWKFFLRIIELLTLLSILVQVATFICILRDHSLVDQLAPVVATSVFVMLVEGCIAMMLLSELAGNVRSSNLLKRTSDLKRASFALFTLVKWCPRWIAVLAILITTAALVLAPGGKFFWDFGSPLTTDAGLAITATAAAFCAVCLPILSSAVRMPGRYAQNLLKPASSIDTIE